MFSEKSKETFWLRWKRMYELACQYYGEYGDLLIRDDFITPCGKRLGRWIGTQRQEAKKNPEAFPVEKRRKLEEIGMVWDVKEAAWQQMYNAACTYYQKEGHLRVPTQFVTQEGLALGEWICAARQLYQTGFMPEHRTEKFKRIAMIWSVKDEILSRWDVYYAQCVTYVEIHGGVYIPKKQKAADGKSLGEWFVRQKSAYRAGNLSPERSQKIERFAPADIAVEHQWLAWFYAAKQLSQANGHLTAPPGTTCHCGNLHAWINTQRVQYNRGLLSSQRADLLEQLGIVWRVRESYWEQMFRRAEQYYREHKNLLVPRDYKVDRELSAWISNQRSDRRQNRHTLTNRRIARLDSIEMSWEPLEEMWEESYALAKEFYEKNGHLIVKGEQNHQLKQWVSQQRTAKKDGCLSKEREKRLDKIDMVWDMFEDYWECMYAAATAYYRIHEQLNIPLNYVTPGGLRLGRWISGQRRRYKQLMSVEEPMIQHRFARLNEIGMIWDASKVVYFTSFQEQAVMYYVRKHEPNTVKMNIWEEYGIEIDVYLPNLQIGIEYDGFFHRDKQESDARKDQICKNQNIRLLRIREPDLPPLPPGSEILYLEDQSPQSLNEAICRALDMLDFPKTDIDTERDRSAIMETYRDINAHAWDKMYEIAHHVFEKHGSLSTHGCAHEETKAMREWLTKQRRNYYDNLLTKRQIDKLMRLHFLDEALPLRKSVWGANGVKHDIERLQQSVWTRIQTARLKWENMYAVASMYYEEKGNLLVPGGYTSESNVPLGKWIFAQRRRYRNGILTPLEIQKLERIMMVWDPKKQALRQWIHAARAYYKVHGHVNAPLEYRNGKGQRLGAWLSNMRTKYKKGTLEDELIRLLEQLSINWYPLDERWEQMYSCAAKFYAQNGHLNVPKSELVDGRPLQVWLYLQRQKYLKKNYMKGILKEEQITRLNAIGMVWNPFHEQWVKEYALAKMYYQQHGNLTVKTDYCTPDGRKLGMWISTQRQAYRGNPNYHITEERIQLLNEIDMEWCTKRRQNKRSVGGQPFLYLINYEI